MNSWVECLSVRKRIQGAAVEKDELAECVDEYHKANNTTTEYCDRAFPTSVVFSSTIILNSAVTYTSRGKTHGCYF